MQKKQTLSLDQIRIDGGTQPRVRIDEGVVAEYAELYRNNANMPPVTVFYDGAAYWLADGFHRYWAKKRLDGKSIQSDVHQGTQRDAILYSLGANADHGLRRNNADKRKAVLTMLEDEKWSTSSDSEIARQCRVTQQMVTKYRASLTTVVSEKAARQPRTYKNKHGKTARMNTAKIGKSRSRGPNSPNPDRQPRPALAQMNLNLPHDPVHGAKAIVAALGADYARNLAASITLYLQNQKEGDA